MCERRQRRRWSIRNIFIPLLMPFAISLSLPVCAAHSVPDPTKHTHTHQNRTEIYKNLTTEKVWNNTQTYNIKIDGFNSVSIVPLNHSRVLTLFIWEAKEAVVISENEWTDDKIKAQKNTKILSIFFPTSIQSQKSKIRNKKKLNSKNG